MRVIATKTLWPFGSDRTDPGVARDADRLLHLHGEQASDTADLYSWREDIGLLYTRKPGHWHRVKLEIAARARRSAPAVDSLARIQALHLM